jgi:hypothetical protein
LMQGRCRKFHLHIYETFGQNEFTAILHRS